MNYDEFKAEYKKLMERFFSYTPDQAGSQIYAERLGALVDSVPAAWEDKADHELGYAS